MKLKLLKTDETDQPIDVHTENGSGMNFQHLKPVRQEKFRVLKRSLLWRAPNIFLCRFQQDKLGNPSKYPSVFDHTNITNIRL